MYRINLSILFLAIIGLSLGSCKKFLDTIAPANSLTGDAVFRHDHTATAALLGIYADMEGSGVAYHKISSLGLASDDFINHRNHPAALAMATNTLTPANELVAKQWDTHYQYIYHANAILEGLTNNNYISNPVKMQLLGEGYFIRAWFHFSLLNYFGHIPYMTRTDYAINSRQPQEDQQTVYPKIIADLKKSKELLPSHYVNASNDPTEERTRPNRYAAGALLSRVYLYAQQWDDAILEADTVLSATSIYVLNANLAGVFLKNNKEAIWQLQPVVAGHNSYAGGALEPGTGIPNNVSLSQNLIDSFEAGDLRRSAWIKTVTVSGQPFYWWYKYKAGQNSPVISEYTTLLRLAELYFIRAEANIMKQRFGSGATDLNRIRQRAGLPAINSLSREEMLEAISKERRIEFFGEYDDRWNDLKRTGRIDRVLSVVKGANWSSTDQLFPIPLSQLLRNPSMVQNPGY